MADQLQPFRMTQDFCIAARDSEHATALWEQLLENLPEGVLGEGGHLEPMPADDVIADSPLARLCKNA